MKNLSSNRNPHRQILRLSDPESVRLSSLLILTSGIPPNCAKAMLWPR
jgi:hypothetical protein